LYLPYYCDGGTGGTGFRLDTPCWTGYHPQFEVRAQVGDNGHDNGHDNDRDNGHDNDRDNGHDN